MYIKYPKRVVERKGKNNRKTNTAKRFFQSIPEPYRTENTAKHIKHTAYITKIK
jgi:hypothetical protein